MGLREVLHDNLHDDHFDKGVSVAGKYTVKSAPEWDADVAVSIVTGSDGNIYFLAAGKDAAIDPVGDVGANWLKSGDVRELYPLNVMTNPVWVKVSNNPEPSVADYISREVVQYRDEVFVYSMNDKTSDKNGIIKVWHSDGSNFDVAASGLGTGSSGLMSMAAVDADGGSFSDLYVEMNDSSAPTDFKIKRYNQKTRSFDDHISYIPPAGGTKRALFDFDGLLGVASNSTSGVVIQRQDVSGGTNISTFQTIPAGAGRMRGAGMIDGRATVVVLSAGTSGSAEIWSHDKQTDLFVKTDTFPIADSTGDHAYFATHGSCSTLCIAGKDNASEVFLLEGGKVSSSHTFGVSSKSPAVNDVNGVAIISDSTETKIVTPFSKEIIALPGDPGGQGEGFAFEQNGSLAKIVLNNYYRLEFSA